MPLAPFTPADGADARQRLNAMAEAVDGLVQDLSSKADQDVVDGKASAADLDAAEVRLGTAEARLGSQGASFGPRSLRPGDGPVAHTIVSSLAALSGPRDALPSVPDGLVTFGDSGRVVRVLGSAVVAPRAPMPLENGRVYRARWVCQRRANQSDPSGDAVVAGIAWLDQAYNLLPAPNDVTVVETYSSLVTASGRAEVQVVFARTASEQATIISPAAARYAVPYLRFFGPDGLTDAEVVGAEDITAATVLPAAFTDQDARITAIETQNLAPRVETIESQLAGTTSLIFPTRSDAAAGTIPNTVTTVETRGRSAAGDGGAALYKKVSSAGGATDTFTNTASGAVFVRVEPIAEVVAAMLSAGWASWVASLPSFEAAASGQVFRNGGAPEIKP
jgi:hypothetical protein